jgi:hypothetical protein
MFSSTRDIKAHAGTGTAEVTIGKHAVSCRYAGGAYVWYIGLTLATEGDVQNLINRHTWIPPEGGYDLSTCPFDPY